MPMILSKEEKAAILDCGKAPLVPDGENWRGDRLHRGDTLRRLCALGYVIRNHNPREAVHEYDPVRLTMIGRERYNELCRGT